MTRDTRNNVTWGKNGGRRARVIVAMLAVFAGLALASAPMAAAKPKPVASWLN